MRLSKKELPERQLLEQIVEKLDRLTLVISLQGRPREEQVKYLTGFGYSNSEMADMLVIPKGTIDTIRANLGKGGHKK